MKIRFERNIRPTTFDYNYIIIKLDIQNVARIIFALANVLFGNSY